MTTIGRRPPPSLPTGSAQTWNQARAGIQIFLEWVRANYSGIPGGSGVVIGTRPIPVIVAEAEDATAGTEAAGWMAADAQLIVESDTPEGLANAAVEGTAETVSRSDHQHKRDVRVALNGSDVGTRNRLNFVDTTAMLAVTDDPGNDEVDIDLSLVGSVPAWPLLAPDGSAAAPSYSFASRPTEGMWSTANNLVLKGASGSGTDAAATGISLRTGQSTGIASSGNAQINVSFPGSASGSSANAYQTPFFVDSANGQVIVGNCALFGAPSAMTVRATGRASGVSNGDANGLSLEGGGGTGDGDGGFVRLRVAPPGASGTSVNTHVNGLEISGADGSVTFGGVDIIGVPGTSTWAGADRASGVTDGAGGSVVIRSGVGTGSAAATSIAFQTPTVGGSGTSQQTSATRWTITTTDFRPAADDTYDVGTASLRTKISYIGQVALGVRTPAQITADQNDYAPGTKGFWRLSSDAARNITGILAAAAGAELIIVNVGSFNIVLKHADAGSATANQLICGGAADITLGANDGARAIYDATTQRWRVWQL